MNVETRTIFAVVCEMCSISVFIMDVPWDRLLESIHAIRWEHIYGEANHDGSEKGLCPKCQDALVEMFQ